MMNGVIGRKTGLACLTLAICLMSGCGFEQGAWVFVDNGSEETMQVQLDGIQVAEIKPGEFERIGAKVGAHEFKVTCGEDVIFEGSKMIEEPENMFSPRRYMFNPDGNNRYWMYKVFYYDEDTLEDLMQTSTSNHVTTYNGLCGEYQTMPSDEWFRIPEHPFVLTDAPSEITGRDDSSVEEKKVLARISEENFIFLNQAKRNGRPTEEDLFELELVLEESNLD